MSEVKTIHFSKDENLREMSNEIEYLEFMIYSFHDSSKDQTIFYGRICFQLVHTTKQY